MRISENIDSAKPNFWFQDFIFMIFFAFFTEPRFVSSTPNPARTLNPTHTQHSTRIDKSTVTIGNGNNFCDNYFSPILKLNLVLKEAVTLLFIYFDPPLRFAYFIDLYGIRGRL